MSYSKRLFLTLLGTLAFCLVLAIGAAWHCVATRAAIDAGIVGEK